MVVALIKVILIVTLLVIYYQDNRARQVSWFLFPMAGILFGILHFNEVLQIQFYNSIITNVVFVGAFLSLLYLVVRLFLKRKFFEAIGLGDVLLFLVLSLTFSSLSFLIIFICSLFFSGLMHLTIGKIKAHKTIPLAGYISLFFSVIYIGHWLNFVPQLYLI